MSPIELKEKRISLGITSKEVAEYLGIKNHLRVSKFEDGAEGKLSDMDIRKYEMFLECKLSPTSPVTSPFEVQLTMPTEDPKEKAKAEKEKRKKAPAKKLAGKNEELWAMESSLTLPDNFILVDTEEKLKEAVETISKEEIRIVDTETYGDTSKQAKNPFIANFCGVQIWCPNVDKGYWIPAVSEHMQCLPLEMIVKYLKTVLDKNCTPASNYCYVQRRIKVGGIEQIQRIPVPYKLVTHNYTFDAHVLDKIGIEFPEPWFDTLTAAKMLDEIEDHNLKILWNKYCCKDPAEASDKFSKLFGKVA